MMKLNNEKLSKTENYNPTKITRVDTQKSKVKGKAKEIQNKKPKAKSIGVGAQLTNTKKEYYSLCKKKKL